MECVFVVLVLFSDSLQVVMRSDYPQIAMRSGSGLYDVVAVSR